MLWKIQKFDWLISVLKSVPFLHECHFGSAWMSFWPAMPELLPGETRTTHSSRVEPEKTIDSKSIKTFHCLTERWYVAIIACCHNVTYRVPVYCSNPGHDTCDMRRVTCAHQQWQHGNSTRRSSKTFKTWNFRSFLRTHSLDNEYLYNTYIFWPLFNVNCSVLRPQNVCKRSLLGYTPDFQDTMRLKQSSAFLFQTRESILTLRDEKQGMARL